MFALKEMMSCLSNIGITHMISSKGTQCLVDLVILQLTVMFRTSREFSRLSLRLKNKDKLEAVIKLVEPLLDLVQMVNFRLCMSHHQC